MIELLDLVNRQRDLTADLIEKVETCNDDEKFLNGLKIYLKTLETQEKLLTDMGLMTVHTIETETFNKIKR